MDGLLWFLIMGGLFYVMMRYGCGAHRVHGSRAESASEDPVCGMTVEADKGYGKMHQGTLYRF